VKCGERGERKGRDERAEWGLSTSIILPMSPIPIPFIASSSSAMSMLPMPARCNKSAMLPSSDLATSAAGRSKALTSPSAHTARAITRCKEAGDISEGVDVG